MPARRLLRPKWIVGSVAVVALLALLISLGFWQLRRHDERAAQNDRLRERAQEPVLPFGAFGTVDDVDPDVVEFELVGLRGTYLPDEEILIRNRTRNGIPGWHVVTPLRLSSGSIVVINRGWVPFVLDDVDYSPPAGDVAIRGLVFKSHVQGRFAATDSADGQLSDMARIDLPRISAQLDAPLYPVYVQLEAQTPPVAEVPIPIDRPGLDAGPHLSYAMQWFIFATIAAIGWVLLVRRELIRPEQDLAARTSEDERPATAEPMERTR